MNTNKDIIIVAGPSAAGKTHALNIIRQLADALVISYERNVISDAQFLLKRVKVDDTLQGFHHTHEWVLENNNHKHTKGKQEIPFTTISNYLADSKYFDFFQSLSQLPKNGNLWLVEWAGGLNKFEEKNSPLHYRYSFERIGAMLQAGILSTEWLQRVKAIIHPVTKGPLRKRLNHSKTIPTSEEIIRGTASWPLSENAMTLYSKDDFPNIERLFQKNNISDIYHIKNNGTNDYTTEVEKVARSILIQPEIRHLNKSDDRDIILVVGRPTAGKKTILNNLYISAQNFRINHQQQYISDVDVVIRKVYEDDAKGGYNHYHDWCKNKTNGHNHNNGEPHMPFVITSNDLGNDIWAEYFTTLNLLPRTGKTWFVEWTGGANTLSSDEIAAQIDMSFRKTGELIKKDLLQANWLQRIQAIIHPMPKNDQSNQYIQVDEIDQIKALEKIKPFVISPEKNDTVLQIFGKDDFFEIEKLFHEAHVPNIYHFEHESKETLQTYAQKITNMSLYPYIGKFSP